MSMNEWRVKFNEWWSPLALREKQAVAMGGSVLGLLLFYLIIWGPYLNRVDELRHRIQTQQKTLSWMEAADKEIHKIESQSQANNQSVTPTELLGYLQKQITRHGLESALLQLKQSSTDSIEMHFQKADFDKLMAMLIIVMKEQNVSIAQMLVVADTAPGVVNADMMLKQS